MVTTTAFAAEATAKSDTAHGPSLGTADPTRRRSLRSARNLLIWCAVLVVGSILVVVLGPKPQRDVYLDPEGRGQQGVGALVEVLRAQGIEVSTAKSIDDLRAAREVAGSGPVTVAVGPTTFLTREGARSALTTIEPDDRLVLLDGGGSVLREVAPDVQALPAQADVELTPDCREPLTHHGADDTIIETVAVRFIVDGNTKGLAACYPLVDTGAVSRGSALVVLDADSQRPQTLAVGFGPALTNARITDQGHAALGLRLLGAHPHLIVYTPSLTDSLGTSGTPDKTVEPPTWLLPGLALVGVAFIVYAVAAGRRLGRLVPEPLPVIVKASETTHSRAELYRAAGDRSRAAATLREGTLARLRPRLRLDARADTQAVLAALAAHGIPEHETGPLLSGADPTDDAGLVSLAQALTTLEEKVTPR